MNQTSRADRNGGILVIAMIAMGVLAMIATAALYEIGNRHASSFHSQSWNEALASAEAGADVALQAMNASIATPGTAWAAWTPADATTFPKTWKPTIAAHTGEGNNKVFATITIDDSIADSNGQKWFRIRSTGVAEVSGTVRQSMDPAVLDSAGVKNHRGVLRKARFANDITGGALHLPQIARTVEVVAGSLNTRMLTRALAVRSSITLSGATLVDSFDSADASKSTVGRYDSSKQQDHADVASNSNGGLSNFNNREVRGSAFCNGGAIQNAGAVVGPVFDNFSATIPQVATPVWGTINVTPNVISNPPGGMTLVGGPSGSPQNYKVTALALISSSNPLLLVSHNPGQPSYVNIWVTGSLSIGGTGFIQQYPDVVVTIYCEGNISIQGGGILNQTSRARKLQIFGVDPASGTRTATIGATNDFIGVVNAPAFDLAVVGNSHFCGAAISKTANIGNSGGLHYDEDLGDVSMGSPSRYEFASWIEDVR